MKFLLVLWLYAYCAFYTIGQSVLTKDHRIEIGVTFGGVMYLGDVQGNAGIGASFIKDLNVRNISKIYGAFATFYPNFENSRIGIKLAVNSGKLHAADSLIEDRGGAEKFRKQRNLSFQTNFIEAIAITEIYLSRKSIRPLIALGSGIVAFRPSAISQNGARVLLRPLMTEGKKYAQIEPLVLLGGGIKFYASANHVLSIEILYRQTFTDYIDDVSTEYVDPSSQSTLSAAMAFRENTPRLYAGTQRGDPNDNDVYFSTLLKYGWMFRKRTSFDCPKNVY